jgi:Tfp pilus assembly protein PilX
MTKLNHPARAADEMDMRTLIRIERGIAMPLALGMLLLVTLVAGGVASVALNASDEARDDRNAKRALAAAETGLQVANLRLNNAPTLGATSCLVGASSGTECPTYAEGNLGTGAIYRFWVSQELAAGNTCGQVPTQTSTGTERCITAAGIVDGVQRRLQSRVLDVPNTSNLLPVDGVFALNGLHYKNNTTVNGYVGSNGQVRSDNTLTVQGVRLGPSGSTSGTINYTQAPAAPVVASQAYTLQTVSPGSSATVNKNGNWTLGGGVTYTNTAAAPRTLTLGGTLTLTQSGDYNFCRITGSTGSIVLAAGVDARVFVDAPDSVRPGSGCPNTNNVDWGEIRMTGNARFNYPAGNPANFQLIVVGWPMPSTYGTANGRNTLYFANEMYLNGLLYATESALDFQGPATVIGASAMYQATFNNTSSFVWNSGADDSESTARLYQLQGWRECRPEPTDVNDPESGC